MSILLGIIAVALLLYFLFGKKKKKAIFTGSVPDSWKRYLLEKVNFYQQLNPEEKVQFEIRVQHFLNTTRITGIKTSAAIEDMLLVAASAIIPVFAFPEWEYLNLSEVLLYPSSFDEAFQSGSSESNILGMVGTGYMEGKMILSKPALHKGFDNERDKKNVGIHEFVHLIDKADGQTDGIPSALLDKQYTIPWVEMARKTMEEIHSGDTDINPYGGVNPQEFYSVISEYFFERPKLLKQKHPDLYKKLSEIFSTDLSQKFKHHKIKRELGRNDPCPCGSGEKFKRCCGKVG